MIEPLGGPAYWLPFIIGFVIAYLIGSVPFGLILARAAGAGDVREIGSGNIGATNVLRTGRKGLALATLVLDVLKGALPVWLASAFSAPTWRWSPASARCSATASRSGSSSSGGKGVATAGGVVSALTPLTGLIVLALFVLIALLSRYVSLASILGAVVAGPVAFWLGHSRRANSISRWPS